jgi:hypothetical protein
MPYNQKVVDTLALTGLLKSANLLRDAIDALTAGAIETAFLHSGMAGPLDTYSEIRETLRNKWDELWNLIGPFMMDVDCNVVPQEPK